MRLLLIGTVPIRCPGTERIRCWLDLFFGGFGPTFPWVVIQEQGLGYVTGALLPSDEGMGQWLTEVERLDPFTSDTLARVPIEEKPEQEGFVSRLSELTSTHTHWQRRLWQSGTLRLADELLDSCINPAFPEPALRDMKADLLTVAREDRGIVNRPQLLAAIDKVRAGSAPTGHAWLTLQAEVDRARADYLDQWAVVFDSEKPVGPEDAARRIGAHLLDHGYHKSSIYTWLAQYAKSPHAVSVAEFLRDGRERLARPERSYTFCVPVVTTPPFDVSAGAAPGWMDAAETSAWQRTHAPAAETIRNQGSFLLTVTAREINTAVDRARAEVFDLQTKFVLGTRATATPVTICSRMWSRDKKQAYGTSDTDRSIEIRAFERHGRISDLTAPPEHIVNALALLQPLRTSPPHIAVMSGWSAIESLLVGPGDTDNVAADRMAAIVAASVLRAEFTDLAWSYARDNTDELAVDIDNQSTNLARAKLFQRRAADITAPVQLGTDRDRLALDRVRPALSDPGGEIRKLRTVLRREFAGLYRKRNLIVHAGRTREHTLHAVSERLVPLIGAGIDRIVDAGFAHGTAPIQLAVQVETRTPYLVPVTTAAAGNSLDLFD